MYACLDALLDIYKGNSWLTVGDGRYGTDAHYLLQKGAQVTASNIDDTLLKKANKLGFIQKFRKENAERLSCKDNTFDFVLCKESIHHFPRPYIGLYEMLRVARKGMVLIEPNDVSHSLTLLQMIYWFFKTYGKKILGIVEPSPYETVGNYIFRISREEMEKIALALDLPVIIFKGINDIYLENGEFQKANSSLPHTILKLKLRLLDLLCAFGLLKPNILFVAILKKSVSKEDKKLFKKKGYFVHSLSRNPYIKR
jgi:ubiquinone/menaquinone biosynthesis C-methylase UbiE